MPLDLIAHGAVLAAGVKAMPVAFAKAGGTGHGIVAAKGGVLAATKSKLAGWASFSGTKSKVASDLKKLEKDVEELESESLMMPFALASPMTLFSSEMPPRTTDKPRQVRRTDKDDRHKAYGDFL